MMSSKQTRTKALLTGDKGRKDRVFFYALKKTLSFRPVHQEEKDPKEIIRLLQDMASEPEILEFSTADSEWEHELIRDYLVSSRTNDGLLIERFPFGWFHSLNGVVIKERILVLHNRQIRLKFEPQEDTLQIIVDCMETGKQFTMELPKGCREGEEIGEELVWRIQELAWEAV